MHWYRAVSRRRYLIAAYLRSGKDVFEAFVLTAADEITSPHVDFDEVRTFRAWEVEHA